LPSGSDRVTPKRLTIFSRAGFCIENSRTDVMVQLSLTRRDDEPRRRRALMVFEK